MLYRYQLGLSLFGLIVVLGASGPSISAEERNFGEDVAFLERHTETVVLGDDETGPRCVIAPAYQARVMTSTARGNQGTSFGWINYDHVASGKFVPHINVFGGEERFWLGPEGGQFSIFFPPGASFDLDTWQTPPSIDTDPYQLVSRSATAAAFRYEGSVTNYSETKFTLRVDREVMLLDGPIALSRILRKQLNPAAPYRVVCYRTTNQLTNAGEATWSKETGLLSIWLLGMYKHGPSTTVVIPLQRGEGANETPINDRYFGKIPSSRLRRDDGVLFFAADGAYRSKLGIPPELARPVCGSYDADRRVLTLVSYNQPDRNVTDYVNSMWELQERPFAGDVVNAYNDGPPSSDTPPLGPFYELETSSPALALSPGQRATHVQTTWHVEGASSVLNEIAEKVLGVSLSQIESALAP